MSKGSRQRTFGNQFDRHFDDIFRRKTGAQWVEHLKLESIIPTAWDSFEEYNTKEISKAQFEELYGNSQ